MGWYGGAEQYNRTINSASTTVTFTTSSKQIWVVNEDSVDIIYFSLDGGTTFAAVFPEKAMGPLDVSRPSIAIKCNGALTAGATATVSIINISAP